MFHGYTYILLGIVAVTVIEHTFANNAEKILRDKVLENYDASVRPVKNSRNAVIIDLTYYLNMIEDLDEKEQVLKLVAWLEIFWDDEFIKWDPKQHNNISRLIFSSDELWKPDLALINSAESVYGNLFDDAFKLVVDNTGRVQWFTAGNLVLSCLLDMRLYPFDHQICDLEISNWAYNANESDFKAININFDRYQEHGQWQLTADDIIPEIKRSSFGGFQYTNVIVHHELSRKPGYAMTNMVIPCLLCSALAVLVFMLPTDAGEKVGLGITILLTFSVFQLMIAESVPKTSDYTPLLTDYLLALMILASLSLGITVLVIIMHFRKGETRVPAWLRYCVFKVMAKVLYYKPMNEIDDDKSGPAGMHLLESKVSATENCGKPLVTGQDGGKTLGAIEAHLAQITNKLNEDEKGAAVEAEWQEMAAIFDRFFLIVFGLITLVLTVVMLGVLPAATKKD